MNIFETLRLFLPREWDQACSPSFSRASDGSDLNPSARSQAICYAAHAAAGLDRLLGRGLGFISASAYRLWSREPYPYGVDLSRTRTWVLISQFRTFLEDYANHYLQEHLTENGGLLPANVEYRRGLARAIYNWVTQSHGMNMQESMDALLQAPSLQEILENPRGECFDYVKPLRFFYRLAGFQAEYADIQVGADGTRFYAEDRGGHVATWVQIVPGKSVLADQYGFDVRPREYQVYEDVRALSADFAQHAATISSRRDQLSFLDRAILLQVNDPNLYFRRAKVWIEVLLASERDFTQAFQAASADIERAYQLGIPEHQSSFLWGRLYQALSHHQTNEEQRNSLNLSLTYFQSASNLAPREHSYKLYTIRSYIPLGRLDDAYVLIESEYLSLRQAAQHESGTLPIRSLQNLSRVYYELGYSYYGSPNFARATACYQRAVQLMAVVWSLTYATHARFGNETPVNETTSGIRGTLDRLTQILEGYFCDYLNSLVAEGKIGEARQQLQTRGSLWNGDRFSIYWARVHYSFGFGERARNALQQSEFEFIQAIRFAQTISNAQLQSNALAELTDVLLREGKRPQALARFRELERINPQHPQFSNLRQRLGISQVP